MMRSNKDTDKTKGYVVVEGRDGNTYILFGDGEELVSPGFLPSDEEMTVSAITWLASHVEDTGSAQWNYYMTSLAATVISNVRELMSADKAAFVSEAKEAAAWYRAAADQLDAYAEALEHGN